MTASPSKTRTKDQGQEQPAFASAGAEVSLDARGFVRCVMPRIVHHTSTTPIKIDPNLKEGDPLPAPNFMPWPRDEQGNLKVISICTCGVSARYPFCDGMHKVCKNEEAGKLYEYDVEKREGKVVD